MKNVTALIIDDNIDVANYIGEVFKDRGITIKILNNYSESLQYTNQHFDILFIDYFIKSFKGTDFVKEYRRLQPKTKTEVIIYSGHCEKISSEDTVLYKPITLKNLNKYIDEILMKIKDRKDNDMEDNQSIEHTEDIEARVYKDVCSNQCIKVWDSRYLLREEFHEEMKKIRDDNEKITKDNKKFLVGTFVSMIGIFATVLIAAIGHFITVSNENIKNQSNIDQINFVGKQLSIEVATSKIDIASIKDNINKISSDLGYLKGKLENKK